MFLGQSCCSFNYLKPLDNPQKVSAPPISRFAQELLLSRRRRE